MKKTIIFILILLLLAFSGCKKTYQKYTSLGGSIAITKANATNNRASFVFKNNLLHPIEIREFRLENDIIEGDNLIEKPIYIKYNSKANASFTIPGLCMDRKREILKVKFAYFDRDMATNEYYKPKTNLILNCK